MIKLWHCLLVTALAFVVHVLAQPPLPQPVAMQDLGRLNPYTSIYTVKGTSVVTTVYSLKYLRVIDLTTKTAETNFVLLRTNIISIVATNMELRPVP